MTDEEKKAIKYVNNILDYELHYCEDEDVLLLTRIDKEQIKTVLNLIQKQQAEIEKKDKIIDEMAKYMEEEFSEFQLDNIYAELYNCNGMERNWTRGKEAEIKDIKQYFEKKVEWKND